MNAPTPLPMIRSAALDRSRLAQRLRRVVKGEVLFDAASRGRYSTDASTYQVEPIGVLVPADEVDVVAAMELAREMKVPVLPRGGGTSQCGQTVGEALVIDDSKHLRKMTAFDSEAMTAEVQPGVVLDELNAWLKPHGLWYPVDVSTSAQATLGGMAGNNSCGSRSIAYGNMVHNVLGIDALLMDGTEQHFGAFGTDASLRLGTGRVGSLVARMFEIAQRERDEVERRWPKVLRRVGGYNLDVFHPQSERPYTADGSINLAHLLVGSEGTLAWFKRLTLKLSRLPAHKVLGVVNFASFHRAMDSARHIVKLAPSAVELVDRTMIDLARSNPVFREVMEAALVDARAPTPEAILLVEFSGEDRAQLLARIDLLIELMADIGLPGSVVAMPEAGQQRALWEVRKAGLNIMMSLKGDGKPVSFIEDCAVPLEHLAEYTSQLTEVFARHGTRGTWYAHASVGTLHVRPILDMRASGPAGGASKMRAIAEEAAELVRRYKGAFSGEHGDGLVRSEWVAWQFGERLTRSFEEIKDLFDPDHLMNPGKIVRASRMDDASLFRYKPGYRLAPLTTALDWSAWNVFNDPVSEHTTPPGTGDDPTGGLGKAVEMCNNNGHCRKFDAGTMCPSFRVTRNERDLTRGRANTLRLALSGQLGTSGLASEAVSEALSLCVSCKGCRRDCPTGVDMARMKIEALYQQSKAHGTSLRQKLVAFMPHYAGLASRLPWLFNARDRIPGVPGLTQRLLGLSARRSLPRWRRDTFLRRERAVRRGRAPAAGSAAPVGEVVLWVDTFNNAFEPDVLVAAQKVLRAAGYAVHVAGPAPGDVHPDRPLCCGRTFLSAGLVDEARTEALRTLRALKPFLDRGATVVGLEPSCLLTMRDEFLAMKLGDHSAQAAELAPRAQLLEEFLDAESRAGRFKPDLQPIAATQVLLHGHCHQKAFDAVRPIERVLKLIPDLEVSLIESSCCGMAGAFGYEAEHFETSMAMAELSLLPAVRAAGDGSLIVADGTSCRHQIHDGAGRRALHVAQVLEMALRQ